MTIRAASLTITPTVRLAARKTPLYRFILVFWSVLPWLNFCSVLAAEPGTGGVARDANVGFLSAAARTKLCQRFPLCDAFLKVTWIDVGKKIGYSRYQYFYDDSNVTKTTLALVHVDASYPHLDYTLEDYKASGRLQEIFDFIRRGELYFAATTLSIRGENRGFDNFEEDFELISDFESLAHHRLNVCVVYPDGKRAWIAEQKMELPASAVERCEASRGLGFFVTTEGQDLFLNNVCRLER